MFLHSPSLMKQKEKKRSNGAGLHRDSQCPLGGTILLPICSLPQEALWSVDREINISVCFFI